MTEGIKFLADESCDFAVVRSLRNAGYDVVAIVESLPAALDIEVLRLSVRENRILVTEDKDFGEWVFAHGEAMSGVLLIRFPGTTRDRLGHSINALVQRHGAELLGSFAVLEPGRVRIHGKK